MTKLILKRLKCGAKTEQSRSESPWVLTFVGDFGTGNADVKLTRRDNWRLDDTGKCTVDHLLFDQFDLAPSKTLVLSAMIEEQDGLGIQGAEGNHLTVTMQSVMEGFIGADPANLFIAARVTETFRSAIHVALTGGDGADSESLTPVRRVTLKGSPGELDLVRFHRDNGNYSVRYTLA